MSVVIDTKVINEGLSEAIGFTANVMGSLVGDMPVPRHCDRVPGSDLRGDLSTSAG